ncbi:MAG: DUF2089 domain-containing protein [Salinivirgaceae bacterium]|nr:DUF2089 domain-containing protein [Salinivirgaceae bacterium]
MKLPISCPSCQSKLQVKTLQCGNCQTKVEGDFKLPLLAALPEDTQQFIIEFVKNSGSLKEMSKALSLSYPTVRNRLDEIINNLKTIENEK